MNEEEEPHQKSWNEPSGWWEQLVQSLPSRNILEGEVMESARDLLVHSRVGFQSSCDITSLTASGCEKLIFANSAGEKRRLASDSYF